MGKSIGTQVVNEVVEVSKTGYKLFKIRSENDQEFVYGGQLFSDHFKAIWLKCYDENYPQKKLACVYVGISISTYYNHYNSDPMFREAVDDIEENGKDEYKNKLYDCGVAAMDTYLKDGDSKGAAFAMFVGKTMMGLHEKQRIEVDERRVNINVNMDLSDKSNKELQRMLEGPIGNKIKGK